LKQSSQRLWPLTDCAARNTQPSADGAASSFAALFAIADSISPMWSSQDFVETRLTAFSGGFEVIRGYATDVAVTASGIVKRFDVVGNINGRHGAGIVDPLLDSFLLEAGEERLGNRVVPTVGAATHAGFKPVFPAEAAPVVAAVLAPLI
jgi:hypothetical protein